MLHSLNPYFDLNPMITMELPSSVLGPSGSVLLDIVVLTLCSIALIGEVTRGKRIHCFVLCLAGLPLVMLWFHGNEDPLQYVRGSAWMAAIMACVTFGHLCRGQRISIFAPAVLLTLSIPLIAKAAFSYGEHAQLIQYFDTHTEEVFRMNGLQFGSSAAVVFEERLRAFGPMGWFTSPNVFGGVLVTLAVIWMFAAITFCKTNKLFLLCSSLFATLCCIAALSSFSKMAMALVILALVFVMSIYFSKTKNVLKKWGGWIAVAVVFAAVYVVFVRGCLAESFFSERSLLLRSQYFIGGLEIAGTHMFGVGPQHIQEAWLTLRPESATEEITSTHNIMIDWLASYSILALCWIAILLKFVWNAGNKLWIGEQFNRRQIFATGLGLAAVIVVVDAQIDLIMFDLGSTLFAFCVLGIAGTLSNGHTRSKVIETSSSLIPIVIACVIAYFGFVPLTNDENLQKNAAKSLIAGEDVSDVAAVLAQRSVTRQSTMIAAKLFLSVGENESVIKILKDVEPNTGVWFMRCKAAATPEDALYASQKLGHIDPTGLQAALLLADCLWDSKHVDYPIGYDRVLDINQIYQIDPARALSKEDLVRVNQRSLTKMRR